MIAIVIAFVIGAVAGGVACKLVLRKHTKADGKINSFIDRVS
jgi:outer membrane lipoprotein SlyB